MIAKIPIHAHLGVFLGFVALTGCAQRLPACSPSDSASPQAKVSGQAGALDPKPPRPKAASQSLASPASSTPAPAKVLLIGIDGSGSMLGHASASNPSSWESLLKAINLSAKTLSLEAKPYRIGGGRAVPLPTSSVTPATNPCFFKGCAPFQPPIPSSLQTLWQLPSFPDKALPLRLLISDLEVNDSDITNLIGVFKEDLAKGASVGILALKLPFTGQVFDSKSTTIFNGSLNRPVYLLISGSVDQAKSLLESIRTNMAQMGVQSQEISMLGGSPGGSPLLARGASVTPPDKGSVGVPLTLSQSYYSPGINTEYQFIQLRPGATGFSVSTIKPWRGDTSRPDLGLVRLERIPLAPGDSTAAGQPKLRQILFAETDVRLDFDIAPTTLAGAYRATLDVVPEQWWIDWDRSPLIKSEGKKLQQAQTTDGLLVLLNTLDRAIREARGAPPAATLCFAVQPPT